MPDAINGLFKATFENVETGHVFAIHYVSGWAEDDNTLSEWGDVLKAVCERADAEDSDLMLLKLERIIGRVEVIDNA